MRSFITSTHHHVLLEYQITEDEIGEACRTHGRDQKCIQNLKNRSEGIRPLGRSRRIWEDNIKMDPNEIV
jgi:hypothetical protein